MFDTILSLIGLGSFGDAAELLLEGISWASTGIDWVLLGTCLKVDGTTLDVGLSVHDVHGLAAANKYANRLKDLGANVYCSYNEATGVYSFVILGYNTATAEMSLKKYNDNCSDHSLPKLSMEEFIAIMSNPEETQEVKNTMDVLKITQKG